MRTPQGGASDSAMPLVESIALLEENVIDLDVAVKDAAADVARAVERFTSCVRERDRAAEHLAHLRALADEEQQAGQDGARTAPS